MAAERLDAIVALRSDVTLARARALIMEGRVRVDGTPITKAGHLLRDGAEVEIERLRRFVSRGGEKLDRALESFDIDVRGRSALDVGASTGGFTDCLLQRGAAQVVAVDVGYGQLDWRLRNDPRVRVMERTNFRLLADDAFPEDFDLIVSDASFIGVRTIVARAMGYLRPGGDIVALVKPQFEAGPSRLQPGGVVRDPEVHRAILREVREAMLSLGLVPVGLVASPLVGPAGNREFLLRLRGDGVALDDRRIDAVIAEGT
jgi:23S rRNA (cytidine1920-2'-O)/16S rRNA (cytidine1409-2'-O)-methyltransferase